MNDADLILSQLKAELAILKTELENCLVDADYEYAHFYQKTIRLKSIEIANIQRRMQSNYDKISTCKNRIKLYDHSIKRLKEKLKTSTKNEGDAVSLNKQIENSNRERNKHLDKLSLLQKDSATIQVDNDIVLQEVEKLIDNTTRGFAVEICEKRLYYILVDKIQSELSIKILMSSLSPFDRQVNPNAKNYLYRLGFQKDDSYEWSLVLDVQKTNRDKIMFIIASLIFDVIRPSSKAVYNLIA